MQIVLYILLFTYIFSAILSLLATFLSSKVYLKPIQKNRDEPLVNIIKPIINVEPNLKENLVSFFTQNYSQYQLCFCLEKKDSEIIKLIEEASVSYPEVPYKIYTEPVNIGPNPKINNIYKAFNETEVLWILISDSNVNAEKDYLKKIVSYIDKNVASISSTILGVRPKTLASHIETIFLNSFYSKGAAALAYFGKTAVVGKGLLLNKEIIKNIGGLESVKSYLAEDFMLGKLLQEKGYKTVLAAHGVSEIVGHQDMRSVYKRHLRWGLIRKTTVFLWFLFEPFTYPLVSSVIGAFALSRFLHINFLTVFMLSLLGFLILDMIQFKNFSKKLYPLTPLAWFMKEIISLILWVDILRSNSIYWRDKKFFLSKDSKLVFN